MNDPQNADPNSLRPVRGPNGQSQNHKTIPKRHDTEKNGKAESTLFRPDAESLVMKRWKKLLLLLLVLLMLSQLPFAYRRYKLGRLNTAILQVNSERTAQQDNGTFAEYKGVIHVHSFLGGHSSGNFEEIIRGAKANELNFVVMTEHPSQNFDTSAMTLKGLHAGVLFINGNEVSTSNSDRLLLIPGNESAGGTSALTTDEVASQAKSRRALTIVAYPQEFKSWETGSYDGVEVYNVFTNARKINPLVMFFDSLWSYRSYPDLLFANFYARPTESLKDWDEAIARRKLNLVALAGNDAHANIGISLNDASGKTLLGLKLDTYERSFHLVRVHVLIPRGQPLTSETLQDALAHGHCFIGFDVFGETDGFSFAAVNSKESKIQGDEILRDDKTRLTVSTPVTSRIILFRDGKPIKEELGVRTKEFAVSERGAYRIEVYLPQLQKPMSEQPWIISNPIYVR
jgi:hypothetical protein